MDYSELVAVYEELGSTRSNLEKTRILSELFSSCGQSLSTVVRFSMGRVFSAWKDEDIGISSKLMVKALKKSTGASESRITEAWKSEGDLGEAAQKLLEGKTQQTFAVKKLTVEKVAENLSEMAFFEGSGSQGRKIDSISELLSLASPSEAKYVVRTVLGKMRLGVGEGTVRDAITDSFFPSIEAFEEGKDYSGDEKLLVDERLEEKIGYNSVISFFSLDSLEKGETYVKGFDKIISTEEGCKKVKNILKRFVQHGYDVTNDFGEVATTARDEGIEGLKQLEMTIFRPINAMLAKKVDSIEEGFEEVGKPAAIDFKYDGMRAQVHKKGGEVKIFTRRLDDVTNQFPEVAEKIVDLIECDECILDCEIVAYDPDDGSMVPFQKLSKRIKRKYGIDKMSEEIPVELRPFDLLNREGSMLKKSYSERFNSLEEIVSEEKGVLRLVDRAVTSDVSEVSGMQQRSLAEGQEGIMMKNLDAVYKPGSRVGYMVKLKPVMETLDLVIIGAEWSEGRRSGWLGSLVLGCSDGEGDYLEVGRLATGLTDEQLEEITERLKPLIVEEDGRDVVVKPEVVVEAEFEEVQKSPTYSSGYALRFPRLKTFRDDKEDADSIEKVERLYKSQR